MTTHIALTAGDVDPDVVGDIVVARNIPYAMTFLFDGAPDAAPFGSCHCIELPSVFGTDCGDARQRTR